MKLFSFSHIVSLFVLLVMVLWSFFSSVLVVSISFYIFFFFVVRYLFLFLLLWRLSPYCRYVRVPFRNIRIEFPLCFVCCFLCFSLYLLGVHFWVCAALIWSSIFWGNSTRCSYESITTSSTLVATLTQQCIFSLSSPSLATHLFTTTRSTIIWPKTKQHNTIQFFTSLLYLQLEEAYIWT